MTKNEKPTPDKTVKSISSIKKPEPSIKTPQDKAPEKKSPHPNWSMRILGLLLIFIGGTVTGIYFMPVLKDRLPFIANWVGENQSSDLTVINQTLLNQQNEIDALEASLGQLSMTATNQIPSKLEARIAFLEENLNGSTETSQNIAASPIDTSQSTRIDLLLSRMSQLEASFVPLSKNLINAGIAEKERQSLMDETSSISTKISDLESRLQNVEQIAAKDNSGILLNLKIAEIKRKIMAGSSYAKELTTLKSIFKNSAIAQNTRFNNALAYLSDQANTNIMTPGQLENKFNNIIPDIISIGDVDIDASWWQNTVSKFKNMVTVRKTDGSSYSESGIDSIISETEMWLGNSNIKSALETTAKLPASVQTILQDWKTAAQTWLGSEEAISDLETIATESYMKENAVSPPAEVEL
ncbi:MAG: hypothetical protein JKY84_05710 [Emcibacteraceae bacterium]|nr:hypothetical protein [Emcibacteraceae bacterium]